MLLDFDFISTWCWLLLLDFLVGYRVGVSPPLGRVSNMDTRSKGKSVGIAFDSSDGDEFLARVNKDVANREKLNPVVRVVKMPKKKSSQRKRSTEGGLFDSDTEIENKEAPKVARSSRGKCRPPGQPSASRRTVVGEADGSYDRALASSERTDGEETSVEGGRAKVPAPPVLSYAEVEVLDSGSLKVHAGLLMESVYDVCRTSGNLKGPYVKQLRQAALGLRNIVDVLAERSETEESRRLSRENKVLRQKAEDLQSEVKAWKKEADEKREEARKAWKDRNSQLPPDWQESLSAAIEKMGHSLQNVCGSMINARLEGLEDRLLPRVVVRPPLAGVKRVTDPASVGQRRASGNLDQSDQVPENPGPSDPALEVEPRAGSAPIVAPPLGVEWAQLPASDPTRDPMNMELASWSTVARRPKKKVVKTPMPVPVATPAPKPKPKVPALPRTAAVIITLQPGAVEKGEDYRSVLAKVQDKISLTDCGITELSLRSTVTGSKIIEIPGPQGAERADSLASKMQEAVGDLAFVARPIKRADIRIVDIDDTVSKDDVVKAAAVGGGCEAAQIRAGEIRAYGRGLGVLHMSLPAAAAKTLVEGERLKVGWSVTRVHALEAKPLRCFRCMEVGHTQPLCPSTKDRRSTCFRCGEIGHKAAVCVVEKPRCAICTEAGKPADHVMGSVTCKPPTVKARSAPTSGARRESHSIVARADGVTRSEETEMDQ